MRPNSTGAALQRLVISLSAIVVVSIVLLDHFSHGQSAPCEAASAAAAAAGVDNSALQERIDRLEEQLLDAKVKAAAAEAAAAAAAAAAPLPAKAARPLRGDGDGDGAAAERRRRRQERREAERRAAESGQSRLQSEETIAGNEAPDVYTRSDSLSNAIWVYGPDPHIACPDKHKFLFIHIPKTAGTTLGFVLEKYATQCGLSVNPFTQGRGWEIADPLKYDITHGHWSFRQGGQLALNAGYNLITVLREPVAHFVSRIKWSMRGQLSRKFPSLTEFSESKQGQQFLDSQCDFVFGTKKVTTRAEIKARLDKIAVVGLTERFDETLMLIHKKFQVDPVYWPLNNISSHILGKPEPQKKKKAGESIYTALKTVSDSDRDMLLSKMQCDPILYELALERFDAELERAYGSSLAAELAKFQKNLPRDPCSTKSASGGLRFHECVNPAGQVVARVKTI